MDFDDFKTRNKIPAETTLAEVAANLEWAWLYAYINKKRFPEGEAVISRDGERSLNYARYVLNGRFKEGEAAIIRSSLSFSEEMLRDRIADGMNDIDSTFARDYAKDVIGGRWQEYEEVIIANEDVAAAFYYLARILNNIENPSADTCCSLEYDDLSNLYPNLQTIPAFEPLFMKSPPHAVAYAKIFLRKRWLEAEPYIIKSPGCSCGYAHYVINGRWIEAEDVIASDAQSSIYYAKNVIKGRWEKGEKAIIEDPFSVSEYQRFVEWAEEQAVK